MLGKNQIQRIDNLKTLEKLDVLDLHSNRIKEIQNVSHLKHLRALGCTMACPDLMLDVIVSLQLVRVNAHPCGSSSVQQVKPCRAWVGEPNRDWKQRFESRLTSNSAHVL